MLRTICLRVGLASPQPRLLFAAAPAAFVALWSTGFVVARTAAPHADLSLLLTARFASAAIVFVALAAGLRDRWPHGRDLALQLVIGGLMHGCYLVAAYAAVGMGLSVGLMALIGALQPMLAAGLVAALGAPAPGRLWTGLAFGIGGVALTLSPALASGVTGLSPVTLALAFGAVLALTLGTVLQSERPSGSGFWSGGAVQQLGGTAVALIATTATGAWRWDGSQELWLSLAWATLGLSCAAVGLLLYLIRRDGAARASALMLLVPPLAAVQGWLLFGETLSAVQLGGFALALLGVRVARRG